MIVVIAEKNTSSAIAAIIAIIWKPFPAIAATTITEIELFVSQRWLSLRSLESGFLRIAMIAELFFSAIAATTAIVAIIWKPGLSYASLLKYVSITIILNKQEGCIMLFTSLCFNRPCHGFRRHLDE